MLATAISVPEVHCQHCVDAIEGALATTAGVHSSRVDLERRQVTVTWDADACALDDLVTVIEDQGYEVVAPDGGSDAAGRDA